MPTNSVIDIEQLMEELKNDVNNITDCDEFADAFFCVLSRQQDSVVDADTELERLLSENTIDIDVLKLLLPEDNSILKMSQSKLRIGYAILEHKQLNRQFPKVKEYIYSLCLQLEDEEIKLTETFQVKDPLEVKEINFIWFGGALPEEYKNNIQYIANGAKVNGYMINIWTDNPLGLFKKQSENFGDNIEIRHYADLKEIQHPNLTQVESNALFDLIEKECIGHKNYAAASDILRLMVLNIYGGHYLDTDCVYLPSDPKQRYQTSNLGMFGFQIRGGVAGINNDALSASKHSKIPALCLEQILKVHKESVTSQAGHMLTKYQAKRSLADPRFMGTIISTGPGLINSAIKSINLHELGHNFYLETKSLPDGDYADILQGQVTIAGVQIGLKNDLTWKNTEQHSLTTEDINPNRKPRW